MKLVEGVAWFLRPMLNLQPIRRVRRNHGLEHATIHVLSSRIKNISMAGRAVLDGFWLYGNVDTEVVTKAVEEAINRMRGGEYNLAVHPNCGTGLVTAGFMTSLATTLSLTGVRQNWLERFSRLPAMIAMSVLALVISQPMSFSLQRHITTLGDPGNLEIVDVTRHELHLPFVTHPVTVHKVRTRLG
jgi:hypothetical protein